MIANINTAPNDNNYRFIFILNGFTKALKFSVSENTKETIDIALKNIHTGYVTFTTTDGKCFLVNKKHIKWTTGYYPNDPNNMLIYTDELKQTPLMLADLRQLFAMTLNDKYKNSLGEPVEEDLNFLKTHRALLHEFMPLTLDVASMEPTTPNDVLAAAWGVRLHRSNGTSIFRPGITDFADDWDLPFAFMVPKNELDYADYPKFLITGRDIKEEHYVHHNDVVMVEYPAAFEAFASAYTRSGLTPLKDDIETLNFFRESSNKRRTA